MSAEAAPARAEPFIVDERAARISVRSAVSARRVASCGGMVTYLSLFESEIEARFERFLSVGGIARTPEAVAAAALLLEPTDAVIVSLEESALIARGGACSFPLYWTHEGQRLAINTALPIGQAPCISRDGLADSIAVVCVALQNEPNLSLHAPLAGAACAAPPFRISQPSEAFSTKRRSTLRTWPRTRPITVRCSPICARRSMHLVQVKADARRWWNGQAASTARSQRCTPSATARACQASPCAFPITSSASRTKSSAPPLLPSV